VAERIEDAGRRRSERLRRAKAERVAAHREVTDRGSRLLDRPLSR